MNQHKRSTTMLSTQLAVILALNIQVQNGNEARLLMIPLLVFTGLFYRLWSAKRVVARWQFQFAGLARDIEASVSFICSVFIIGVKSVAFGVGVAI
jgi:hypothetical protein